MDIGHVVITSAHHVHSTVDAALARRKLARRTPDVEPDVRGDHNHAAAPPRKKTAPQDLATTYLY
jgi:hypothetical protein